MKKAKHDKERLNALHNAPLRPAPRPKKKAFSILSQIVRLIPEGLIDRLAEEADADIRSFRESSHVVALLYGHIMSS